MASIIENAAKGQRSAINSLYEDHKQKVYFTALCLLGDEKQAANVTVTVFREIWNKMKSALIGTPEQFETHAVYSTVDICKGLLYKRNPKALKLPANKNFMIPLNLLILENHENCLDFWLRNLPHTQKYIFVMHTAGNLEVMQIARMLKFDSLMVRAALNAEAVNWKRICQIAGRECDSTLNDLLEDMKQREADTVVPDNVDKQVYETINRIAEPYEKKMRIRKYTTSVIGVLLCACALIAVLMIVLRSDAAETTAGAESTYTAEDTTAEEELEETTEAAATEQPQADGTGEAILDESLTYYADIEIAEYGTVTVQLDQTAAPITVANFVELAESGFYDGLTFHRIIEGFMMQGGDPEGNGTGGSDETIVGEFADNGYENDLSHTRGAISMARSSDYDSASSQFFIVHQDASASLDGQYAVFGYVTEGLEIVDAVCEAAEPTDNNGTIPADAQPVITAVTIRRETT